MVQFNLLPEVKQQYMKTVSRRRLVNVVCLLIGGGFLLIFTLMFLYVKVNQTSQLSKLDTKINDGVKKLQANKDLDKIITLQNQLASLPTLHNDKSMTSRVFGYIGQLVPSEANINTIEIDVANTKINIKGSADSIPAINKFIDTIKYTDYNYETGNPKTARAFSDVVLRNFTLPTVETATKGVTYEIELKYNPVIFQNTAVDGNAVANSIQLVVPKKITTRSEVQKPSDLFGAQTDGQGGTQ